MSKDMQGDWAIVSPRDWAEPAVFTTSSKERAASLPLTALEMEFRSISDGRGRSRWRHSASFFVEDVDETRAVKNWAALKELAW